MIALLQRFGSGTLSTLGRVGRAGFFLCHTILRRPHLKQNFSLVCNEIYSIGVLSLIIIVVSALFIGMVIGLQGFNTLNKFAATAQLGQLLALSITRELGPVVTALLFAGRAGSALTAEIGLMKTTEQLSSMEMMGVNPLWQIIAPRFWAGTLAMPLLALIFSATAICGGYLIGVLWLGVDSGSFWNNMKSSVNFRVDIVSGIIKSMVFGVIVTWIAVFEGYDTQPTAEGISQATTRTVVNSSVAVLGIDFLLTAMMIGEW